MVKKDDVPEGSTRCKRVKTRGIRKQTPPSRKSLRLSTIKETSLSLDDDSGSSKEPQRVVDLEFSDEEGDTADILTLAKDQDHPTKTISVEMAEEECAAVKETDPYLSTRRIFVR